MPTHAAPFSELLAHFNIQILKYNEYSLAEVAKNKRVPLPVMQEQGREYTVALMFDDYTDDLIVLARSCRRKHGAVKDEQQTQTYTALKKTLGMS